MGGRRGAPSVCPLLLDTNHMQLLLGLLLLLLGHMEGLRVMVGALKAVRWGRRVRGSARSVP